MIYRCSIRVLYILIFSADVQVGFVLVSNARVAARHPNTFPLADQLAIHRHSTAASTSTPLPSPPLPSTPMLGLRYSADVRTLGLTATYFVLFFFCWTQFRTPISHGIPSLLIWCVLCYFSFLGAVATHNCIHCPMFHSKWANKAFQLVLTLVYGHPVSAYVPGHNLSHHKYTQQAKDVMRTTKMRFHWHLLNGLFFFFRIGLDGLSNDRAYFSAQEKLHRPIVKQLRIEQVVLYALAAVFFVLSPSKWFYFAFLPHFYAKFCIISLNMLQHDGCDMESEYNFARNFTGQWLNWFCYNNGYHTIHHLHPGLHWSKLPDEHDKTIKPFIHPNLDQPYILTYIWRTFVWPGVRINYLGEPLVLTNEDKKPDEPWFYQEEETYSTNEKYE